MRPYYKGVILDVTTVISALRLNNSPQKLFISNLSRLLDSIILYDRIITTERIRDYIPAKNEEPLIASIGFYNFQYKKTNTIFDFDNEVFTDLFDNIFVRDSDIKDVEQQDYHQHLTKVRLKHPNGDQINTFKEDIDIIEKKSVQLDWEVYEYLYRDASKGIDDAFKYYEILANLRRVRTLLGMAVDLNSFYDASLFRLPIMEYISINFSDYELNKLFHLVKNKVVHSLNDKFSNTDFKFIKEIKYYQFPMFLLYILRQQPASMEDLFRIAIQMRHEDSIKNIKSVFYDIHTSYQDHDAKALFQANRYFDEVIGKTISRLGGGNPILQNFEIAEDLLGNKADGSSDVEFKLNILNLIKNGVKTYNDASLRIALKFLRRDLIQDNIEHYPFIERSIAKLAGSESY